jgi:hypothetical protein
MAATGATCDDDDDDDDDDGDDDDIDDDGGAPLPPERRETSHRRMWPSRPQDTTWLPAVTGLTDRMDLPPCATTDPT